MHANTSNTTLANVEDTFGLMIDKLTAQIRNLPSSQRFTDDELEYIYTIGHAYYKQGRFEKARDFFSFLKVYRPVDLRYLKALASAQQMCRQLQDAIHTYSLLFALDKNDHEVIERLNYCKRCVVSQTINKARLVQ